MPPIELVWDVLDQGRWQRPPVPANIQQFPTTSEANQHPTDLNQQPHQCKRNVFRCGRQLVVKPDSERNRTYVYIKKTFGLWGYLKTLCVAVLFVLSVLLSLSLILRFARWIQHPCYPVQVRSDQIKSEQIKSPDQLHPPFFTGSGGDYEHLVGGGAQVITAAINRINI